MSVTLIAEIGISHDGIAEKAELLTRLAIQAGADVVKYQFYRAVTSATATSQKPPHLSHYGESQLDLLKKYELSARALARLVEVCRQHGVKTCCSGDVRHDYDVMRDCGVDIFKFGSDGLLKHDLIDHVASFGRPLILSTGMSRIGEIEDAVEVARRHIGDITVLHCTSQYPAPAEAVNLRCIETLRRQLNTRVGYSDHTRGVAVSIAAVALGAEVIERHFIDTHESENPDEAVCLDPAQFRFLADAIRNVQAALGSSVKRPTSEESEMMKSFRHSLVTLSDVRRGECFTRENLGYKRPGTGLSPKYLGVLLGRRARSDFNRDHVLSWDDVL